MFSPPTHCESKGSPSPEKPAPEQEGKGACKDKALDPAFPLVYEQPRHIQYATHFPIPQVSSPERGFDSALTRRWNSIWVISATVDHDSILS
jgi:hypothetical protein